MRKTKKVNNSNIIKEIIFIIGLCFIFIIFFEILSFGALKIRNYINDRNDVLNQPLYENKKDALKMMTEEDEYAPMRGYAPYSIWQRKDFNGTYVSFQDGLKDTCYNSDFPEIIIWMFGGSTMEGYRSENNCATIPSRLSYNLNEREPIFKVYNFGVGGYQSTQELYRFMYQLKQNKIEKPDLVIFYDGLNDLGIALDQPFTDNHGDYLKIRLLFEHPFLYSIFNSNFGKILLTVTSISKLPIYKESQTNLDYNESVIKRVEDYIFNMQIAKDVCLRNNCSVISFVQPGLPLTKKELSDKEKELFDKSKDSLFFKYYPFFISESIKRDSSIISLTHAFDKESTQVFLDAGHLTKKGNDIIAREMIINLEKYIKEIK